MLDLSAIDELFDVDPEQPDGDMIERLRFDDALEIPFELTDADIWANYTNENLYVMDKRLREFFKAQRYRMENKGGLRTAVPLVFAHIFGRKAEPSDSQACRLLHRLMEYYSTSWTGESTIGGKRFPRVYKFSRYATQHKRPYSIRLRLEEANERGEGKPFVPYATKRVKGPARKKKS